MKRERGSLLLYGALGAGAVILVLSLTTKLLWDSRERCRNEYAAFVAQTKALGEAAQKAADQEKARLQKAKETADANAKRLTLELNATRQRLRDERARSNLVPAAPPTSSRPERACYQRAELRAALQQFIAEVGAIIAEGDDQRVVADTARGWIRDAIPSDD